MAVVAVVATVNVRWMLANRCRAVMTRATRTQHLRMVHRIDRFPHVCGVAIFADIGRLHVLRPLACGVCAVVAAKAVAGNIDVIEVSRDPASRRVAVLAVIATV